MQFIIGHSKTKRKIEGSFQICASRDDLEHLVAQIKRYLDTGHHYGWLEIHEPMEPVTVNTPPNAWDDSTMTDEKDRQSNWPKGGPAVWCLKCQSVSARTLAVEGKGHVLTCDNCGHKEHLTGD